METIWDRKWDELILVALNEDIGSGDVTTLSTVPPDADASGVFLAKEAGVICGLSICSRTFALLDPRIRIKSRVQEGAWVEANEVLAVIEGPSQGILMGERVSLNFLRHLSGIATQTRLAVQAVEGTKAHISDTRKTTPGLRSIEKYAVRTGGGTNHRFNLSDGILIKDNHIRAAGGIKQAVDRARKGGSHLLKIEVETETIEQIEEALEAGADVIMLDNMSLLQMAEAVRLIAGRAIVEASGNMADQDLRAVAETGVDLISIGALTHSVRALDISLKFE